MLLFRDAPHGAGIEVLIAHPGGPFWAARDAGAWSIPKGEIEPGEDPVEVARREFEEETGQPAPPGAHWPLGDVRLASGKLISAWAVRGDLDVSTASSNEIEIDWPPRSGRRLLVPEVDRIDWATPAEARRRLNPAQVPFVDRLLELLVDAADDEATSPTGAA